MESDRQSEQSGDHSVQGERAIQVKSKTGSDESAIPERRSAPRHLVDGPAVILLINVGSRLPGRILNLSLGGCRVHTHERFPVGIYTRIETEFQVEGVTFRLGGVVQAIFDRHTIGIRFLDISDRKHGQLMQLIDEVEKLEEAGKPATT